MPAMKTNAQKAKKTPRTNGTNGTNGTRFGRSGKKAVTRARADEWPRRFIAELRKRGIVLDACKAAKVSRNTAYRHREASKEFAQQWKEALEDASDVMEAEAFRRAVKGVKRERGIYYQGERVGTELITEYSDGLLALLLKAHRPDKFRETTKVEHSGEVGVLTPAEIEQRRLERWKQVTPALSVVLSQTGTRDDPEGASDA
jgi:hypothetical protein